VIGNKVQLVLADGREGLPDEGPFNVIHLGAAATMESVEKFIDQLRVGGVLIGPIITGY
jgi:protein-L-isoaspartate(D-aspartate) O-methyltransferase